MRTFSFLPIAACLLSIAAQGQPVLLTSACTHLGPSGGTSTALDTTGASLLVVLVTTFDTSGTTMTDNKGNTWTPLVIESLTDGGGTGRLVPFYSQNPTVGTGHTFTTTAQFSNICAASFSGLLTSGVLDAGTNIGTSGTVATTTIAPGSITPSSGSRLVVTFEAERSGAATKTIDSSYTIAAQNSFVASNYGSAIGYKAVTGGSATSPIWTLSTAEGNAASIAAFKVASSALAAGSIAKTSDTATTANLTATDAAAGTAPYTYQWYRSTSSGFTPGAGNILTGKTALTLADTGLTGATTYYYVIVYTDNAAATANSAQFVETTPSANPIFIGCLGDSITNGFGESGAYNPCLQMVKFLQKTPTYNTIFFATQYGVNGTTSVDWSPGGGGLLSSTITSMTTASISVVMIMVGTNDSKPALATSAAAYQTNLQATITSLKTAGFNKIILNASPYVNTNTSWNIATSNALLVQYQAKLAALAAADPGHVFLGDLQAYSWFQNNVGELTDGVHPSHDGNFSLGYAWAQAYRKTFLRDAGTFVIAQ